MRKIYKSTFGVAAAGLMAFSLAACSTPAEEEPTSSTEVSDTETMAEPEPLASIPTLTGVDTQVTVDQGFVDAITGLGLTPGVVGTATFTDGVFAFPITGGNVDYYDPEEDYRPYVQGEILHEGSGISLTNGTTLVELSNFDIDPGNNSTLFGDVSANGEVVVEDAPLFRLDGTTLNPLEMDENGNAVLEGTTVYVSEEAAALLNETYGTDAVTGDLKVGIAKITAAVPAS
ncbi:hypothetical protein [Planctomonas psychrotolerans]|uniref:hypothetical protein n=1 Tax=Planctomonas psychrotolerans TaxID=2528712 RepID=UPI00123C3F49|nr:hypothetical protein [Planctomonas psychrotolerans]